MAIPHYAYLKMKMTGPKGIITIAGDYKKSLECAHDSSHLDDAVVIAEEKRQIDRLVAQATEQPAIPNPPSQSAGEGSFKPAKETKQVPLDPANPKQCVTIDANLRENRDIFAWSPKDMPGVPRKYVEHKLHVQPDAKLVKQPFRLEKKSSGCSQPAS
ncbi:hypothetical protein ZWY2020_020187 [Hordeum vulgare]|nr:hypothetical protein ZWY2020_020187 [Hordeum vulgare]